MNNNILKDWDNVMIIMGIVLTFDFIFIYYVVLGGQI
jgi:hypothetical protein